MATALFTRSSSRPPIGYTWTVTPSSLLEARFGFDHVLGGKVPPYLGGPSMQALYGISGLPDLAQSYRRPELAVDQRIFPIRQANQQPAVPEPDFLRSEIELLLGAGSPFSEDGL